MMVSTDFADTLPSQYDSASRTKGAIAAILSPFDEVDEAIEYLLNTTNLGYGATGTWLDYEGRIVGADRRLDETPPELLFTFSGEDGATSETQGFDGGYLLSVFGNYIPDTEEDDITYTDYLQAKADATFRGTSLADISNWIYDVFGVACLLEFGPLSDVFVYPGDSLTYIQKRVIEKFAPVSAGSMVFVI